MLLLIDGRLQVSFDDKLVTDLPPQKTGVCLLYCFVLSPLISLGAVPYHHLALSVKELT